MTMPDPDTRSAERKRLDDRIADELPLAAPDVSNVTPKPLETHLLSARRPVAIFGVVENGLVRPLDPGVTLPEHSRVIIVTQGAV